MKGRAAAVLAALAALAGPPSVPAPGAAAQEASDSLFRGAPPAERLRPPRDGPAAGGRRPVPVAAGLVILAGAGLLVAGLRRRTAATGGGAAGRARESLREIEARVGATGDAELCAEVTSVLRRYLEETREGGWPPGRPVRSALPARDPLAAEMERWARVRFGGAGLTRDGRRRVLDAARGWLRRDASRR